MRVLIIFLFSFIVVHGHAQDYIVNVQQFGVEDGLASRDVQTLFIDRDGFLWVSGHDYLQRYDGYEFKTYDLKGTRGKVRTIVHIHEDEDGWFQMVVSYKLNRNQRDLLFFDPITGQTLSKEEKIGASISTQLDLLLYVNDYDSAINKNTPDQIFFSRNKQIITYDYNTHALDTIPLSLSRQGRWRIGFIDSASNYWMDRIVDPNSVQLKVSPEGKVLDSLERNNTLGMRQKTLYGWNDQLYAIGSHVANQALSINNKERKEKGQDYIYEVKEDGSLHPIFKAPFGDLISRFSDGHVWTINEKGWKVYNLSGDLEFELKRTDYSNGLFDMFQIGVYTKDKTGKIYFGTAFGLNIIEIQKNPFTQYMSDRKEKKLPFENSARGMYDALDELVVNLEFGGLVSIPKVNPDSFQMHVKHSFDPAMRAGMYVGRPMVRDAQENYWIAEVGYLHKWSSNFQEDEKFYLSGYFDSWSLHIDANDCLWIGTDYAIGKLCKDDSVITEYPHKSIGIDHERFSKYQLQEDKQGKLWISTENGLYVFDKVTRKIIAHYHANTKGEFSLPESFVYYLHIDSDENRWLGTRSGLVFWDSKTNEKRLFNRNDGLSNNVIYAIKEDDYGKLWLSSDYGIMSFDKNTFAVRTYLPKDGISHQEFNRTSHHQSKDGTIYFGGLNGVTAFHPKDFIGDQHTYPAVAIADYEIFDGAEAKLLNKTKELSDTKTITFHPNDRYFKLKFVLPTFDEVNNILYGWKIEGLFDDWNYQKENTLQFSAMPYGEHKLHIKGQGLSGGWSPHELVITINVLKPFYLQTWFLIASFVFLGLGIWAYSSYRLNKLQKDKEKLQQEIELATAKISEDKAFIERQAEELKKLDQLKSRFFANVSHELRTPLSLMIGPIKHLLKNGTHTEKDRKLLEFVKRNSLHLKNLVNEILDLSKLENNKMELQESPVDFYYYVSNHMSQFYSFGTSEAISFTTNYPEKKTINILLDKNKFEKIINNFLSNAMKFTPPGGDVSLTIKESETDLHLLIRDTGRGIHPSDLPHVFDRFYQSTQTDAPTEGGTGIGLSLCWELAGLMGGKVWAESVLGEGSTFHFQFPKKLTDLYIGQLENTSKDLTTEEFAVSPEAVIDTVSTPPQQPKHEATILIAEDNPDLRAYYQILLSDYNVILTEHGKAALDYLQQTAAAPQLIISDLMMPVMDGMQFLTRIKTDEKWRHIPVIMLTAKANRITKIKALRIGIDDYITKPFDDEELLVRVQNLLSHQRDRSLELQEEAMNNEETLTMSLLFSDEEMAWLETVENFVKTNVDDSRLSVNLLAQEFNMSNSTLLRQLRKLTGLTPNKYIIEHRLNLARELLEIRKYNTITQVAYQVGFKDAGAFARSFKQRFGTTPTEVMEG